MWNSDNVYVKRFWAPDFPFAPSRWPFFYGWCILVAGTIGGVATVPGQTGGVSVFTDILMVQLGLTRLQVSAAYMVGTLLSGLLLTWGGRLVDRFGSRKAGFFSALGLGCSVALLSQCDRLTDAIRGLINFTDSWGTAFFIISICFLLIRFFGQGMLMISCRAMIGKWFDRRRGLVISISGIASSLAFSFGPKTLNIGIQGIGWRETWIVMATILLTAMILIAWVFFRDNPEECGLFMDGSPPGRDDTVPKHPDRILVKEFDLREAMRTYAFWIFALTMTWSGLFGTGYVFHIVSVGEELGLLPGAILDLLIPAAAVSIVTNLVVGWLSDHVRIKYILILKGLASSVWPFGMLLMPSFIGETLMVAGMGISMGCLGVLSGVVWPRFYGRRHLGAISGTAFKWGVIGSALGPLCFAMIRALTDNYRIMSILAVGVSLVLMAGAFYADNPQRKLAGAQSRSS